MITEEQIAVIREYVSDKYFYPERLIKYLTMHDRVGVEVFRYVAKDVYFDGPEEFRTVLPIMYRSDKWDLEPNPGEEDAFRVFTQFEPEDVDTFVKRIPFNFYHQGEDVRVDDEGNETLIWRPVAIDSLLSSVGPEPYDEMNYHRTKPLTLEDAYKKLEFLFYEKKFSLDQIFNYSEKITESDFDCIYGDWFDYIDKCLDLGWDDFMPDNFYYQYNLAREKTGEVPITYYVMEYDCEAWQRDREEVKFFKRKGNELEFYGRFPCDEKGDPVMRWIGIDIKNPQKIECTDRFGLECHMKVTLAPDTVVKILMHEHDEIGNVIEDIDPEWIQIYAGPQMMNFNYKLLKEKRVELGYTQQEVADAVQANVRTYQKWENGETKPDGYYLLRILNWLDINDIQSLTEWLK